MNEYDYFHLKDKLNGMTRKMEAKKSEVDWGKVNRATEIPRTYEIQTAAGGYIYKMYKPSEFKKHWEKHKSKGWVTCRRVISSGNWD